jgi:simple sugar transport system permease protein
MLALGYNPIEAYIQLFKGAFVGKLNFGTTLQKFTPLLLTSIAFVISSRVGVSNVGVEGELYLGAIAAAWVGFTFKGVPGPILILLCLIVAIIIGAAWAYIPGSLRAYLGVNEVCVTILMNYVAIYITSYLVNGPLSAKTGVPQTPTIARSEVGKDFKTQPGKRRSFYCNCSCNNHLLDITKINNWI